MSGQVSHNTPNPSAPVSAVPTVPAARPRVNNIPVAETKKEINQTNLDFLNDLLKTPTPITKPRAMKPTRLSYKFLANHNNSNNDSKITTDKKNNDQEPQNQVDMSHATKEILKNDEDAQELAKKEMEEKKAQIQEEDKVEVVLKEEEVTIPVAKLSSSVNPMPKPRNARNYEEVKVKEDVVESECAETSELVQVKSEGKEEIGEARNDKLTKLSMSDMSDSGHQSSEMDTVATDDFGAVNKKRSGTGHLEVQPIEAVVKASTDMTTLKNLIDTDSDSKETQLEYFRTTSITESGIANNQRCVATK